MIAHLAAALALVQSTTQPAPLPPPSPCVTASEMSAMMAVFAPELVNALGRSCTPHLLPDAFLVSRQDELVSVWRGQSAGQRVAAYRGIARLMLPSQTAEAPAASRDAEALQAFENNIAARVTPMLTPTLCKQISRLVESLAPLPATNLGMFVGAILGIGMEVDPSASGGPPICRS